MMVPCCVLTKRGQWDPNVALRSLSHPPIRCSTAGWNFRKGFAFHFNQRVEVV